MKHSVKNPLTIEKEIASILAWLRDEETKRQDQAGKYGCPPEMVFVFEKPLKTSTFCKGLIHFYDCDTYDCMQLYRMVGVPQLTYAFYTDVRDSSLLGSVAIYSRAFSEIYASLRRSRQLFGRPILKCTIELGRRPFIDVHFGR